MMVDVTRAQFPSDMAQSVQAAASPIEGAAHEVLDHLQRYAKEKPVSFGLWAFGIGFVLGWRLKPW